MPEITPEVLNLAPIWFFVFLFSTTCHEGAHALAAKLGGDMTAFHGGQVSLNPIPHIQREPFGMIAVPLVSYFLAGWMMGWASTPYDPIWAARHPRRAAWMALAGPAANFTLMLIAAIGIRIGLALEAFKAPDVVGFTRITEAQGEGDMAMLLATFLSILFILNLILGTFNLLPFPPLDGHAGITVFMSEQRALEFLEWVRGIGMLGLLASWVIFGQIFGYIFTFALNVLYFPLVSYG